MASRSLTSCGFRIGQKLHGFTISNKFAVPEFDLMLWHLKHDSTNARYVHVECDDTNNVFATTFRTPVSDSSGLPHVLEHLVLCGSERFPVRDPFFNMTKRSLNTYMNALTAQDHTMYPFATQNLQDYYNLMEVYLDAIFFPKLDKMDYLQEGHRLEIDPENDKKLVRTGVVYNEMKGTLSGSSRVLMNKLDEKLLSGSPYEHISGGYPPDIADLLNHERLVKYHKTHYHPSNALFFSYGNMELERHLNHLNTFVLKKFIFSEKAANVWSEIANSRVVNDNNCNKIVKIYGPPEPMLEPGNDAMFCMARVLSKNRKDRPDSYQQLLYSLTSSLLFDSSSAPLYSALIDSQIAPDFAPGSGFGNGVHPTFGVGVQGINGTDEAKLEEIKQIILKALTDTIHNGGFDDRRIQGVIHQLELMLRRKPTTFGLNIMHAISNAYAGMPCGNENEKLMIDTLNDSLTVDSKLDRLRDDISNNPTLWQDQIKKMFLEKDGDKYKLSNDIIQVLMLPDENFLNQQSESEAKKLEDIAESFNHDFIDIKKSTEQLRKAQDLPQDVNCLPTLNLKEDVPKAHPFPISIEDVSNNGKNNILWVNNETTNGLIYFRIMFDISHLPEEIQPYVEMFTSLLGSLSIEQLSYQDLGIELDLSCDGLSFSHSLLPWLGTNNGDEFLPTNHQLVESTSKIDGLNTIRSKYRQVVSVGGCCLPRNLDKTMNLLNSIMTESKFNDPKRLETLFSSMVNNVSSSLTNNALRYAKSWSHTSLGGLNAKREVFSGLSQVQLLLNTSTNSDTQLLSNFFSDMAKEIFKANKMSMKIVAGGNDINQREILASMQSFSGKLEQMHYADISNSTIYNKYSGSSLFLESQTILDQILKKQNSLDYTASYIPLPIPVHNSIATIPTHVDYGHSDDASLMVLGQLLSSGFLHKSIREKGGAYGCGSSHGMDGLFSFSSFYDPNSSKTLQTYAESVDLACKGNFEILDVDEALLSMFGSIDSPQEIHQKGSGSFFYGTSNEDRQHMRNRLFEVNKQTIVDAANKHLGKIIKPDHKGFLEQDLQGCVAIAGNAETINDEFIKENSSIWEVKNPGI